MRNIFKIFRSDARKIYTNVVAMVVIMGLSVIPCLYAWFNIFSNWDPYGAESTKNLSVAVATRDEGTSIDTIKLNIGDMVISNLKANKTINWVFTDSGQEAVDGVTSGKYYAALVIDNNFSDDMISFLGGNPNHPKIEYYENEKKNAIAPKITGKVKNTVQDEVNKAFVSTLTEGLLNVSKYAVTKDTENNITNNALDKLNQMDGDLTAAQSIIDSYISMIDAANSMSDAAGKMTEQMNSMTATGQKIIDQVDTVTDAANASVNATSDMISGSLGTVDKQLVTIENSLTSTAEKVKTGGQVTEAEANAMKIMVTSSEETFKTAAEQGKEYLNDDGKAAVKDAESNFATLSQDLDKLSKSAGTTSDDAAALIESTVTDVENCRKEISGLNSTYQNTVKPQVATTMQSIQNAISETKSLVGFSGDSIAKVSAVLSSYPEMLKLGTDDLQKSKKEIADMQTELRKIISDMNNINKNQQYGMLIKLLESDSDTISEFVSSPVSLDTELIFPIANNGSATAPFYIVLSIWVGALILIAIIKTKLKNEVPDVVNIKTYQEFFGRYILFFLVGQIQTIITVLGALMYVKIQCLHPVLFLAACLLTSFTFTLLLYSLAYAFGAVGEAVAVVLMVIQVAGSGGTFPIEVLPHVYQKLYDFMPFMYSMNAVRECIGGMNGNDYGWYLSGLAVYIGISLIIGLILSIPCRRLIKHVEGIKEDTDLMA
jgi:putative membrane protein